jgi:hypothetical protein
MAEMHKKTPGELTCPLCRAPITGEDAVGTPPSLESSPPPNNNCPPGVCESSFVDLLMTAVDTVRNSGSSQQEGYSRTMSHVGSMPIFVKAPAPARTQVVYCDKSWRVAYVAMIIVIRSEGRLLFSDIKMMFRNNLLDNCMTLDHYGIVAECTLHALLRDSAPFPLEPRLGVAPRNNAPTSFETVFRNMTAGSQISSPPPPATSIVRPVHNNAAAMIDDGTLPGPEFWEHRRCEGTMTRRECADEPNDMYAQVPCMGIMHIFAKTLTGRTETISCSPAWHVGHIARAIETKDGTPWKQIKMLWMGKQLDNRRTLGEYGIGPGCTVYIVLNLRGGKPVILYKCDANGSDGGFELSLVLREGTRLTSVWPPPSTDTHHLGLSRETRLSWRGTASHLARDLVMEDGARVPYVFYEFETLIHGTMFNWTVEPQKHGPVYFFWGDEANLGRFLHRATASMGFDHVDSADFVTHWLPQIVNHGENCRLLLQFLTGQYEDMVSLTCTPKPKLAIRVFMIYARLGIDVPIPDGVTIASQITAFENVTPWSDSDGSALLEWGGGEIAFCNL